jgi:hypothetical protein
MWWWHLHFGWNSVQWALVLDSCLQNCFVFTRVPKGYWIFCFYVLQGKQVLKHVPLRKIRGLVFHRMQALSRLHGSLHIFLQG